MTTFKLSSNEKILAECGVWSITNKRLVEWWESWTVSTLKDYSFRFMSGTYEQIRRPFLVLGMVLGVIMILVGVGILVSVHKISLYVHYDYGIETGAFLVGIGIFMIIVGIIHKTEEFKIIFTDGEKLIPNVTKEFKEELRKQIYD